MCGRYKLTTQKEVFGDLLDVTPLDDPGSRQWPERLRFNVAPTDLMPVVFLDDEQRRLQLMRWGLIPPWAGRPGAPASTTLINARVETLHEKAAFKHLVDDHRCVVPVDGYYEWQKRGRERTPYLFAFDDDRPFFFAGLWRPAGRAGVDVSTDVAPSYTVLTAAAIPALAPFHDRMPIMLDADAARRWLRGDDVPAAYIWEALPEGFGWRRVSRQIGNVRVDDERVLVAEPDDTTDDAGPQDTDASPRRSRTAGTSARRRAARGTQGDLFS